MTERREYPFSAETLKKGDVLGVEQIEEAYSVKRETPEYALATLRAAEFVRTRFAERGVIVTIEIRRGAVHILTDEQAVESNRGSIRAGIRKIRRAHERQLGSDRSLMTEKTRVAHDRDVEVAGRMISAISREQQRRVLPAPVTRSTPLPPPPEQESIAGVAAQEVEK